MELLIILGVIFAIINGFTKKKQQEAQEARRRAAQAQQEQAQMRQEAAPGDPRFPPLQPQVNPPPVYTQRSDPRFPQESTQREARYQEYTPPPQAFDPRFPPLSAQEIAAAQARRRAELEAERKRHQAVRQSAAPAEGEITPGMGGARMTAAPGTTIESRMEATRGRRHTLEASSLTGHAHTESSMTVAPEHCPPEAVRAAAIVSAHAPAIPAALARLSTDQNAVMQAILYSEILGKPKAMRRA